MSGSRWVGTWTAVNIPPDMPTVGRIIAQLYQRTTGDRIDGVIATDPMAVAEILRAAGPHPGAGWAMRGGFSYQIRRSLTRNRSRKRTTRVMKFDTR